MSDGPHRSLPMRPQWKSVAERASKDAWSIADVSKAAVRALECDLAEIPVRPLRRILGSDGAASLFSANPDALAAELDRARAECRGSSIGNAAIEISGIGPGDRIKADQLRDHAPTDHQQRRRAAGTVPQMQYHYNAPGNIGIEA